MSLKDHPVIVLTTFALLTFGAGFTASEWVRVKPLERDVVELNDQLTKKESALLALELKSKPDPLAPVVKSVVMTDVSNGVFDQNFQFSDADGDAAFMNYVILQTNTAGLRTEATSIDSPSSEQIRGTSRLGKWNCSGGVYFVRFALVITDRAGHASAPYEYVVNCKPT